MILLELLYRTIIFIRNKLFDWKVIRIIKTNAKVISIGNITTGGSGKTPLVIFLSKLLKKDFENIIIVTGGYKRKSKGFKLIDDISKVKPKEVGDESLLIAEKTKLKVAIDDSKWKAAKKVDKLYKPDLIILDDGFQHRKLHRDLDIIIYDSNTDIQQHLLPKGRLREPKNNLNRADIIVSRDLNSLDVEFNATLFKSEYKAGKITTAFTSEIIDLKNFQTLKLIAVSGIAKPDNFIKLLTVNELIIEKHIIFKDHNQYDTNDINEIIATAEKHNVKNIITTDKDLIKLRDFREVFDRNNIELFTLELEVEIFNKETFKNEIAKGLDV